MRTLCAAVTPETHVTDQLPRARFAGLIVAGLVVSSCLSTPAAWAQDPGAEANEVPIGSFTIGRPENGFSVVERPAGAAAEAAREAPDTDSVTGRWFFQSVDQAPPAQSAESLYADARKALDAGNTTDAQRLFERLVAEAPESELAGEARQHLGRIYRTVATGAADSASTGSSAAGSRGSVSSGSGARPSPEASLPWSAPDGVRSPSQQELAAQTAVGDVQAPVSRLALHEARVSPIVDEKFLSQAGDRVFFSAGSAELGSRARGVIQSQARFLQQYPNLGAAIEGHADDGALPGAETQRLSEVRAAAVRDRLVAEGVKAERLTAFGRGRDERVSDCPTPDCQAQNRRAITILLDGRLQPGGRPSRRAQGDIGSPQTVSPTQ